MIKDSGERRVFSTGSVRDVQQGKGRCDLMPLIEVEDFINTYLYAPHGHVLTFINKQQFIDAAASFAREAFPDPYTAVLELAIHFEEGALKYGEFNWQKGIPVHCYIDSGIRHYLKHKRGDTDERHDRAFLWNMLCAEWTRRNLNVED